MPAVCQVTAVTLFCVMLFCNDCIHAGGGAASDCVMMDGSSASTPCHGVDAGSAAIAVSVIRWSSVATVLLLLALSRH